MTKIFVVGMPASGKTTFGAKLAKALNYSFVDLDKLIEENENKSIAKMFEDIGELGFREIERFYLQGLKDLQHAVISTGGGSVAFLDNMEWMNSNGLTIYLEVDIATLIQRNTVNRRFRPLFADSSNEEIEEKMYFLMEKRVQFYELSTLVVNKQSVKTTNNISDNQQVNEVKKIINQIVDFR